MKLGDKPLAEMSEDEMREAIQTLRASREELRAEAIRKKREREAGVPTIKESRQKKTPKPVDNFMADTLAFLTGDKNA